MRLIDIAFSVLCVAVTTSFSVAKLCHLDDLTVPEEPHHPSSWAIVCLVRSKDTDQNTKRNVALAKAILPFVSKDRSFSFQFFSEDLFSVDIISAWEKIFEGIGKVQLVNVHNRGYNGMGSEGKKFGYKWMCKFFTVDMYDYLRHFDYYLRVDSDNILSPMTYNMFEYTERNKLEYAYVIRKLEPHQMTADTLPTFVQKYVTSCDVQKQIMEPPLDKNFIFNFYNNFHIGKISFFNRPDVRHFLVASNNSFLYANRWGDSTIQAYAVRLFMSPQAVQQLPNITYHHMSHGNSLVSSDPTKKTMIPQFFPSGNWTEMQILTAKSSAITHKKQVQSNQPTPPSPRGGKRGKNSHFKPFQQEEGLNNRGIKKRHKISIGKQEAGSSL